MICPFRASEPYIINYETLVGGECTKARCAWWNEHFRMCAMVVDAYLKGQEDSEREERIRTGG